MARGQKPIKVCLTNRGKDSETPWAADLGPAPGAQAGSRKVRLVNVPFLHAKPTWGDVIVVSPVPEGFLTWDRNNVPFSDIASRILEDSGRWAMIIDYARTPTPKTHSRRSPTRALNTTSSAKVRGHRARTIQVARTWP